MSNGWLRLWLLSLIRSSNFHVMQEKKNYYLWMSLQLANDFNTSELQSPLQAAWCDLHQASTVSNIFLYKKLSVPHLSQGCAVCHPNRACPSVPSHLWYVVLATAEPRQYNAGMVDSCLLIQCHGLFPLSVCFDVSIQRHRCMSQHAFSFKAHSRH